MRAIDATPTLNPGLTEPVAARPGKLVSLAETPGKVVFCEENALVPRSTREAGALWDYLGRGTLYVF
jgi:hypothetical protein